MKKISLGIIIILIILVAWGIFAYQKDGEESHDLTVATNAEFRPFEQYENGEYVGFDMDLVREIATIMGKNVVFKNMEFDATLVSVTTGNTDIAASALTVNKKRERNVDFTDAYYIGGQVLIVRADDSVFTGTTSEALATQLEGKTIGVCSGFIGQTYVEGDEELGYSGIRDAKVKLYDNATVGVLDLRNGKLDVFILDISTAHKIASSEANKGALKVIDVPLTVEKYALAVKKGNKELLQKLNDALKQLKENGKLGELLAKWELK